MSNGMTDPLDDWFDHRGTDRDPELAGTFADEDYDPWELEEGDRGPPPAT